MGALRSPATPGPSTPRPRQFYLRCGSSLLTSLLEVLRRQVRRGPCAGGRNAPLQTVKPCDELTGHLACEEIRSEDGTIIGVVTEKAEQSVVSGQELPSDRTYLLAAVADPDGGHVELYVAEGTRADRPHTVHDPADVPALTMDQVRAIVTDPAWTS